MAILFFTVWVLLNGKLTFEVAIFGVLITAALYWFCCKFMNYSFGKDLKYFRKFGKLFKLFFILVQEIIKACFALLPYIYGHARTPEPVIVHFDTDRVKTPMGRVFLANCITMTPGTITGSLTDNGYLVHCLDKSMAVGLDESPFVDAIQQWEEK